MQIFLLNIVLLGISSNQIIANDDFCTTTITCIDKIKKLVPDTNKFWFGDQYELQCGWNIHSKSRMKKPINCYNPSDLIGFHSLGSRLFRVKTFTSAYLQNLKIFPRITFKPEDGTYEACGHNFNVVSNDRIIDGHPDMDPVNPYYIKNEPEISWSEMDKNDSLIVIMVDVGFGKLKFLSLNFPRNTQVIQKYRSVENFRYGMPTPMAVLIFRPPPGVTLHSRNFKGHPDAPFDLTEFMMKHGLENSLIGLNWIVIGADPFSIEKARIKNIADNCHFLIQKKLISDQRWPFVESFPLNEMDSLMRVSFIQEEFHETVCCSAIHLDAEDIYVDPLSDTQISSTTVMKPPKITSLRSLQNTEDNYQRSLRHYIVSKEDRFTLAMFDPRKKYLYWMVVDIPADYLVPGDITKDSLTVAEYFPPIPEKPNDCQYVVLMLFKQPRGSSISEISEYYNSDHSLRSPICKKDCIYRGSFSIEEFKAYHKLKLSAISWFKVCYDIYEASRQIKKIEESKSTISVSIKRENGYKEDLDNPRTDYIKKLNDNKRIQMQNICDIIKQTNIDCAKLSSSQIILISWYTIILSFIIKVFI